MWKRSEREFFFTRKMKALTYNQYRIINILLLTVVYSVVEAAISLGANIWFPELPYVLSLSVMFVSLEMMRWNWYAVIAALVSAIITCFFSGAVAEQYLIYILGNLTMLLGVFFLKKVGKDRVRASVLLTLVYVLLEFVLAEVGRGIVAIILGSEPLIIVQFLTTDVLTGFFAVVVIFILRRTDGMFEDQRAYLLRLEEERRNNQED